MSKTVYSRDFYDGIRVGSRKSAQCVVPLILELVQPKSVVDIGCGDGAWLSVFQQAGVDDIFGADGDYVDRETLLIPGDRFKAIDLSSSFALDRKFDLAVSLEVAEHLPPASARGFIASLVRLAPLVLFSAAIPLQGGAHHVNEQWPDYWVALFQPHNYVPIDCIRGRLWQDDRVEWWYAQNCLLFVSQSALEHNEGLRRAFEMTNPHQLSIVHPRFYTAFVREHHRVRTAWRTLLKALKHSIGGRLSNSQDNLPSI
jgi:SAM-dependent methyltransferase